MAPGSTSWRPASRRSGPRRSVASSSFHVVAVDVNVVVARTFAHESHERRLEEKFPDLPFPERARLRRTDVEAHVGIGDGILDLRLEHCKTAHVYDRMIRM